MVMPRELARSPTRDVGGMTLFFAALGLTLFFAGWLATEEPLTADSLIEVEGKVRRVQLHDGRKPHLDIELAEDRRTYRIPKGRWSDIDGSEALLEALRPGEPLRLHVDRKDWQDPWQKGGLHLVFVDAIAVRETPFYTVADRLAWDRSNVSSGWVLLCLTSLVTLYVGFFVFGRGRGNAAEKPTL